MVLVTHIAWMFLRAISIFMVKDGGSLLMEIGWECSQLQEFLEKVWPNNCPIRHMSLLLENQGTLALPTSCEVSCLFLKSTLLKYSLNPKPCPNSYHCHYDRAGKSLVQFWWQRVCSVPAHPLPFHRLWRQHSSCHFVVKCTQLSQSSNSCDGIVFFFTASSRCLVLLSKSSPHYLQPVCFPLIAPTLINVHRPT